MEPRVIKTKDDHQMALAELERLMELNPAPGSKTAERLELFASLIETYEKEHFPFEKPDPVEAIRFRMEEQGLKQRDLVPYIGSKSKVSEVLAGKRPLSVDMVRALHQGLGIPTEALIQKRGGADPEEIDWSRFPVREMIRRKWTIASPEDVREHPEKVAKGFFELLGKSQPAAVALYRRTIYERSGRSMDSYALRAWVARVLIRARKVDLPKYRPDTVCDELISRVAQLSNSPKGPVLAQEFLLKHGIALIIEPHLPKTRLDGGAMLNNQGNPIIGLTIRHDRIDNFWFTLIHELAHVRLHLTDLSQELFVDDLDIGAGDDPREREADRLAERLLIPRTHWRRSRAFIQRTQEAIEELSHELGIHPAIVAGRVRREAGSYQILTHMIGNGEVRKLFQDVVWS